MAGDRLMALTADEITDLGIWPFIAFGSPERREAAFARYERFIERQRAEAVKAADDVVQP